MTRKTAPTLLGAALLALGLTACSPDKAPGPKEDNGPEKTVVTQTVTKTSTATATATPEYLPGDTSSEYNADEISFMKAACDLYDEGNSAVDVLVESFDMPETVPLEHDPERVGELIIMSIPEYCPRHYDEIEKFNDDWA